MRGLSRGDVTLSPPPAPPSNPPPAAPFLLLDSLTGAPHLSSFTVQSGETASLASPPPTPHAAAAPRLPLTRTQTEQQTWSGLGVGRGGHPPELQAFEAL